MPRPTPLTYSPEGRPIWARDIEGRPICGAKRKNRDAICQCRTLGENGRCRMHGGSGRSGAPIKTGRYSVKTATVLAEKIAQFADDPRPGDLTGELALMRGLLQNYLENLSDDEASDFETVDRVHGMCESIARTVERISRMLNDTALTQAEVQLLYARIADATRQYVPEANRAAFLRAIGAG